MKFNAATIVPNFSLRGFRDGQEDEDIMLDQYAGKYAVLLFMPMEDVYLDVSLKEMSAFSRWIQEEKPSDVIIFSIFATGKSDIARFMDKPMSEGGLADVAFPILCDRKKSTCETYGAMDKDGKLTRSLYIIGRYRRMLYQAFYHQVVPRAVSEVKRALDNLRVNDKIKVSFQFTCISCVS